jgi:hypothetical protein
MSSESENDGVGSKTSGYIKLTGRKKFAEWKRKTEALAAQQGYSRFLINDIQVPTEDELEVEWAKVEAETDLNTQKQMKIRYLKMKSTRKLSTSASCMLMMAVPGTMSKKLESHMENPHAMYRTICSKYDKRGNNKLSNLCKELEKCKLRSVRTEPDDWFTNLSNLNDRIEKISADFKKTDKQLAMHIMNNMCDSYKDLKLLIENKTNYLDDIEELQTTIQDHWETYYADNSDSDDDTEVDEEESVADKKQDHALTMTEEKKTGMFKSKEHKQGDYNKNELKCDHCGRTGHTSARCFKLHGYPKNWEDRRKCFICGKTGHIAKDCKLNKSSNNESDKDNDKEDNEEEINGLFIGAIMCYDCETDDKDEVVDEVVDEAVDEAVDEVVDEVVEEVMDEVVAEAVEKDDEVVVEEEEVEVVDEDGVVDDTNEEMNIKTTIEEEGSEVRINTQASNPTTVSDEEAIQWMSQAYGVRETDGDLDQMMRRVELAELIRNDRSIMMMNRGLWGQTGTREHEHDDLNLPSMYENQARTETADQEAEEASDDEQEVNMITTQYYDNNLIEKYCDTSDSEGYSSTDLPTISEQLKEYESDPDSDSDIPKLVKKTYEDDSSDEGDEYFSDDMYDSDDEYSYNDKVPDLKERYYESDLSDDEDIHTENVNTVADSEADKFTYANIVKGIMNKKVDNPAGGIEKWLGDTGASCHVTGNSVAMNNTTTKGVQAVVVGDGRRNSVKKSGSINLVPEGTTNTIQLEDTKVVPNITKNILSIGLLLKEGGTMTGDQDNIKIRYKGNNFVFKRSTKDGLYYLYASRLHANNEKDLELTVYDVGIELTGSEDNKDMETSKSLTNKQSDNKTNQKIMNRKEAHEKWGHQYKDGCDLMAKYMGIKLQGKLSCTGCGLVKAREKGVAKKSSRQATKKGERISIDTTGPYPKTGKGTKYWMCALDDFTDMSWLHFAKSKNEMTKFIRELLQGFKGKGIKVDYIRCDNAGEHMQKLKDLCREEGIELEYTAPGTPRQNGRVEKKIHLIWQRALTLMVHARLTKEMQAKLWAEAVNCSGFLENIIIKANRDKPAFEKWSDKSIRSYFNKLVQFGRVGYVAKKEKIKSKMSEKGFTAIMVGYAANSGSGTYRLYNPKTKRVIQSRDVKWDAFIGVNANNDPSMFDFNSDANNKVQNRENQEVRIVTNTIPPPIATREFEKSDEEDADDGSINSGASGHTPRTSSLRQLRSMALSPSQISNTTQGMRLRGGKQLAGRRIVTGDTVAHRVSIVNHVQDQGEEDQHHINLVHDEEEYFNDEIIDRNLMHLPSIFTMSQVPTKMNKETLHDLNSMELVNDFDTPNTIHQALNGKEKELWKKSATAEVNNFLKRGSWIIRDKAKVKENGRKLIGVKWVFKKKDEPDGSIRFKSRIVTKGYMQIPGVDYTESFSPVATSTSLRVGLALTLYYEKQNWTCELVDVEAAFLEGKLKSAVYIDLPVGMVELGFMSQEEFEKACAELTGGMYGCVDAALLYFIRFCEWATDTKGLNLQQSIVDPCVFFRKNKEGTLLVLVICHVDDCCIMGRKDIVDEVKMQLKKRFGTVEDGKLRKLLGVRYEWKRNDNDESYIEMTMNDKANEIIKSYEKYTNKTPKNYPSPGTPGSTLSKNEKETIMLKEYRSLVGQTMFYSTKIAPECAFANGQLARHMQNPGEEHWEAMARFVGYIKSKPDHKMIMKKPTELRTISYCDSSYGDCKDTRRSTMGEVHTIGGAITSWKSQRQRSVTQSSSEAEYITLSEAAKEQKFTQMLLEEVAEVEIPGYIYGDNEASIFLAKNKQVSNRTKHIDIREHFIRECVDNGRIELKNVKSNDNMSDIMTKNLPVKIFKRDGKELLEGNILHEVLNIEEDVAKNKRENDSRYKPKCEDSFVLSQHAGLENMTEHKERKLNKEITSKDKVRQCCNIGRTHRRNLCGIQVQKHVKGLQERKQQERTEEYEKTKVLLS